MSIRDVALAACVRVAQSDHVILRERLLAVLAADDPRRADVARLMGEADEALRRAVIAAGQHPEVRL